MQSKPKFVNFNLPDSGRFPMGPSHSSPIQVTGFQRTLNAVKKQLLALGMASFMIGLLHPIRGMLTRRFSPQQILKSIGWLRYQNRNGENILLRPIGSLGTILLDDLSSQAIARLRRDGLEPAVVVETSPGNYQCWLRLIKNEQQQAISSELIHRVGLRLAREYGGDPNAADWYHYGRLAGFTNRKPKHEDKGRFPFVKLRYADSMVARNGRNYLLAVKQAHKASPPLPKPVAPNKSPDRNYSDRLAWILEVNRDRGWVDNPDLSRLDLMIARSMCTEGVAVEVVAQQLLRYSPRIRQRKTGHLVDYLCRTLLAAGANEHPFSRPSMKTWLRELVKANLEQLCPDTEGAGVCTFEGVRHHEL